MWVCYINKSVTKVSVLNSYICFFKKASLSHSRKGNLSSWYLGIDKADASIKQKEYDHRRSGWIS